MQDILGVQFQSVGTSNTDIQNVFLNNGTGEDTINLYTPGVGYTTYAWSTETYKNDYEYAEDLGAGWADNDAIRFCKENENEVTLDLGQGFWLYMKGDGSNDPSVQIAGEVKTSESETISMTAGLQDIVIMPYPTSYDIQCIQLLNGTGEDTINIYTPGVGYTTYSWSTETYKNDYEYAEDLGPGWADNDAIRFCADNENAISLGVNQGVWLYMKGDGVNAPQVKFVNPSNLK